MTVRRTESIEVPDRDRLASALAYVVGALPALVNLDPYVNLIGTVVPKNVADGATVVALIAIIGLWFTVQGPDRGFVRAHITQMCVVVFITGLAGWAAPSEDVFGTGVIPLLVGVVALAGMLVLAWSAWAGRAPSLPWIGQRSRRWGRYERRENT